MKILSILTIAFMTFFACNEQNVNKEKMVLIKTTMGDITIKLYNETPKHRDNFIDNVENGNYDETLFHRIIQGFMIQGGDPQSKGAQPGQRLGMGSLENKGLVDAEFSLDLIHKKGALAAARTGGPANPEKKSSNCQFYIVQGKVYSHGELARLESSKNIKYTDEQKQIYTTIGGTPMLDQDYTVYGEVVSGLDIVDKIASVQKDRSDRPNKDVSMTMEIVK